MEIVYSKCNNEIGNDCMIQRIGYVVDSNIDGYYATIIVKYVGSWVDEEPKTETIQFYDEMEAREWVDNKVM